MAKYKKYSDSDKLRAVALLDECKNPAEAARVFGVQRSLILRWRDQLSKRAENEAQYQAEREEISERISDVHKAFLELHGKQLSLAFEKAIKKTIEKIDNTNDAMTAVIVAEKLAHIINMFSTAKDIDTPNKDNLLEWCVGQISIRRNNQ